MRIPQPHDKPKGTLKIDDTYEAAFYMMMGARLVHVEKRKVAEKDVKKLMYHYRMSFFLIGVKNEYINTWKSGKAYGNLQSFKRERLRIKKAAYHIAPTL